MAHITLPPTLAAKIIARGVGQNFPAQENRSEWTGQSKVLLLGGVERLRLGLTFRPMATETEIREARAFFWALRGIGNTFDVPFLPTPQSGTAKTLDGDAAAGSYSLVLDNVTGLLPGMPVSLAMPSGRNRLLVITEIDVPTNTISFTPAITEDTPDGSVLEVQNPVATMRLADPTFSYDDDMGRAGFAVDAVESTYGFVVGGGTGGGIGGGGEMINDAIAYDAPGADLVTRSAQFIGNMLATCARMAVNRTALANAAFTSAPVFLMEGNRKGWFTFDGSNLSAKVTADTAQGIYVAPASDPTGASGAWVRKFDGPIIFDWFGAVPGDYATGVSPDCLAAWNALQTFMAATVRNSNVSYSAGSPEILFPGAQYYFSGTMEVSTSARLRGYGVGFEGNEPTWLRFPANTCGIHVMDDDVSAAVTTSGGTIIEGFLIQGPPLGAGNTVSGTLTTDVLKSAIRCNTRTFIQDVAIRSFAGCGILLSASSGAGGEFGGNINGSTVDRVSISGCMTGGVYVSGGDANVIRLSSLDVARCGRYGIFISPFLSSSLINCQVDHCGIPSYSGVSQYSLVHYSGRTYQARYNASTATLQATTPGTNEAVWMDIGSSAGATSDKPTWDGTGNYVPGGVYGGTGNFTSLLGCYYETGSTVPDMPAAMALYGFMGSGVGYTPQLFVSGTNFASNVGYKQSITYTNGASAYGQFGGDLSGTNLDLLSWNSTTATPSNTGATGKIYQEKTTGDLVCKLYNTTTAFRITGNLTSFTFGGRSTAESIGVMQIDKFKVGGVDTGGVQDRGSAAPATGFHGKGDIRWNDGTIIGTGTVQNWINYIAGTPGTWAANHVYPASDPSLGIGYATGAGGAVTQTGTRTNSVTLNKVCGSVTLVSAAGSTSWTSMIVFNNTVLATDNIVVTQKSGTDNYMFHVTGVANGSFEISFATMGGTTTEQPVFNFAVLKTVIS